MKYLNLTEGYNPMGAESGSIIDYEFFQFSGGEPHIKINLHTFHYKEIIITIRIGIFNDIGKLVVATDALRRLLVGRDIKISLFLAYFPGARQDRVMVKGEPLTVKVYADIINQLNFNEVSIFDPHSEVTPALINNVYVHNNHQLVVQAINDMAYEHKGYFNIVSPDAGANKKIKELVKYLASNKPQPNIDQTVHSGGYFTDGDQLVKCDKSRDVKTGKITGFDVYADDLNGNPTIVVDDICDGGATFIGLAKELRKKNAGDLYLIVSHGIFSKGFKELRKYYKGIYTTDSIVNDYAWDIPEIEKGSEIVTIIKFKNFK
jgi:ribose-phosphate pyrophosphokinase